jgi:RNA polymerase sigma-70 factor (ECF subfamily)
MSDSSAVAPETWVDQHGDVLYRFALARVSDPELAADLVQDTFLEALRGRASFQGESSPRTWLTAILKYKIIDEFRRSRRLPRRVKESSFEPAIESVFDRRGHGKTAPGRRGDEPDAILDRREFWEVLKRCVLRLPEHLADAFVAIELGGLDREGACERFEITAANLAARLYRARLLLRHCLEIHWLAETAPYARGCTTCRRDRSAGGSCRPQ